jgi:hypothetical protein
MTITNKDNLNDSISPEARDNLNRFLAKKWEKINRKLAEKKLQEAK